jgi:LacI family transcriptional regulator
VFSHSQAPRDVARHLLAMKGRVDILAATAVNHHAVAEAVGELAEAGIPCFALLSDFAQGIRKIR